MSLRAINYRDQQYVLLSWSQNSNDFGVRYWLGEETREMAAAYFLECDRSYAYVVFFPNGEVFSCGWVVDTRREVERKLDSILLQICEQGASEQISDYFKMYFGFTIIS